MYSQEVNTQVGRQRGQPREPQAWATACGRCAATQAPVQVFPTLKSVLKVTPAVVTGAVF